MGQRNVSIHAAQVGCDTHPPLSPAFTSEFQFTQPKWAATCGFAGLLLRFSVSIHAAQAGCDLAMMPNIRLPSSFNSRSPSGLRLGIGLRLDCLTRFNSRSPSGLRLPREPRCIIDPRFQFTQPKWAATIGNKVDDTVLNVSIHAAQVGCDFLYVGSILYRYVSIHAAQVGCDGCCKDTTKKRFSQRINRESPYQ